MGGRLAAPLLAAGGPIEAGPELRKVRLLFGESAARLLDAEILERSFREMKAVLADPAARPEERLRATRVLLAVGDRNRATFGREAAQRAAKELESAGFDPEARRDVAQRAAGLLFALGEWSATVALLGREFDAATAPLEVLVPWARASERIEGADATAAALALHERLLGAQGSGGRMAADAAERPGLLLGLARLYLTLQRKDDARATLGRLPAVVRCLPSSRASASGSRIGSAPTRPRAAAERVPYANSISRRSGATRAERRSRADLVDALAGRALDQQGADDRRTSST